ncbi:hypothetical protein, partial [Pseudoalteromonas sp. SIMBA_162]|uniref:hypothetical protein n=1 Tax=Pseudoalteromonas sp. SIMBA_162 TaxID=3080867 RepID=UPI00397BDB74
LRLVAPQGAALLTHSGARRWAIERWLSHVGWLVHERSLRFTQAALVALVAAYSSNLAAAQGGSQDLRE